MTPQLLPFTAPPQNNLEAVAAHFRQHQGHWVSAIDLMRCGGTLSWRTRVSECRRLLGMAIQNKTFTLDGQKRSLYRYVGPR